MLQDRASSSRTCADVGCVKFWSDEEQHFPPINYDLCDMLSREAPVNVLQIRDLDLLELAFGNHRSADQYAKLIWEKVRADVRLG